MQQIIKKISFENILYGLLFLFPLFALGVRHWSSITFSLIILIGITYSLAKYRKDSINLHKYEKLYLWFLVFYFIVFLISMMLNPFERFGDTRFGNEIRFVLVIPLYLLLIKTQHAMRYLVIGSAVAIIIAFGFCIHELYIEEHPVFLGEYSKLFTGPVILLYLVVVLSYWIPKIDRRNIKSWSFLVIVIAIATFSIITTEVRAAYIGYALLSILFVIFYIKGFKKHITLLLLVICLSFLGLSSASIKSRMGVAINDLTNYLSLDASEKTSSDVELDSVSVRLELWRASPYFISDNPLFGNGNGNFNNGIRNYVSNGLINPYAVHYAHPHNVFVGAVIDKGLFGLTATLLVFFFPLYIYIKTFRESKFSAITGIFYVTVMFVFSMNETAPFEKSNFVATYLVYSLVIFQHHMQFLKNKVA